ncbi:MAG TPA: MATE family efflux transporter, partial [Devosia sp.]|nr:MATE family efflux transporter [Devosia sp.]
FFFMSFIIGLASGSTVLIGQAWGARDQLKVKQIAGTTLTVTFLGGLVVAILGGYFIRPVMGVLGVPANIFAESTAYGLILLYGMPGFFIYLIATSILRGVGDSVTPLIALVLSILVGLVVTPALILGWGGLPRLGLLAAAVAFILGFVVVLVFLFVYLRARAHPLAPDRVLLAHLGIDFALLRTILKLGIPAGVQMIVSSVAAIVVVGIINRFGSDATAAYGAVGQIMSYVQFPAMSIGIAASIFGAQAIGAAQQDQLGRITRTAFVMNIIITGALVLLAYIFSEQVVRLFITEPRVVVLTETLLHIILWSVVMFGFAVILSGIMRASGDVLAPMLISLGTIVLVETPLALYLSTTPLGLDGIWAGYATSFCTMFLLQGAYYLAVWRRRPIRKLV